MLRISARCVHGAGGNVSRKTPRPTPHALQQEIDAMCEGIRNDETRGTYRRSLREFVRFVRSDKVFRFAVEDVGRYKRYLVTKRRFSRASVSTYLTAVRRLCAHLVDRGILSANPAIAIPARQPKRKHRGRALSNGEVERLEDILLEGEGEIITRDRAIVALMLHNGFSGTEIARLNVGDMRKHAAGWSIRCKGREIPITGRRSVEAMQTYMGLRKATGAESGKPLFLSAGNRTRGQRMSTRGVRSALQVYFDRAGLSGRGLTPQALRYTAARLMAEAGASTEDLKRRLGLATDQTARIYQHTIAAQHE